MLNKTPSVPIVVVLYHREEDTRRMFEQLARVTDGYDLIIVNNGFDDPRFIKRLKPLHYIENQENTGAIRGINQGLELAEGKYVAVLHSDILIYDEGWLDHIIEFMERRDDVGLVGIGGWHVVSADGSCGEDVETADRTGYRRGQPVCRFTEVAAAKGIGLVMRTGSVRLDASIKSVLSGCDIDLSLSYRSMNFKVYSANIEHELAPPESTRDLSEESRQIFITKWRDLLPISRKYPDEERSYQEIKDLLAERERLLDIYDELVEIHDELLYVHDMKESKINEQAALARELEETSESDSAKLAELRDRASRLEASLAKAQREPLMKKFKYYMRTEGPVTTIKRLISYTKRRLSFVGRGSRAMRK